MCIKRKFTFLTLLISGSRKPGNDIDVYLSPLIDDLNTLWNDSVQAYDAYKKKHSISKQCYCGQLMISLHMEIYPVSLSRVIKFIQFVTKEHIVNI